MKRIVAAFAAGALLFFGIFACSPVRSVDVSIVTPRPTATLPPPTPPATPTGAPTESPAPTASPVPDELIDSGAFDAYFSDVVFVGDSLTVGLGRYVRRLRRSEGACLSEAAFVAGEGVSIRGLRYDQTPESEPALLYDEELVSVSRGIRDSGKTHAIILLGTNDFGGLRLEKTIENYGFLLDRIQKRCPGIAITLTAVPPASERFCEQETFSIAEWNAINPGIEQLCEERGLGYLSFCEAVSDADGYLDAAYSSDNLIHLNADGYRAWLHALRVYAMEQSRLP